MTLIKVSNTADNFARAVAHVNQMRSDYGGTELLDPLRDILTSPNTFESKERMKEVFVLTDGSVGNTEQLVQMVQGKGYNIVLKLMK